MHGKTDKGIFGIDKEKLISFRVYALLFILFFVMHYLYLGAGWFESDELDVMVGGKAILSGYQIYGDFSSQHMPGAYYISALFGLLGADTVSLQRIYFYAFYALMWTIMYGRYKKYINPVALVIYPILFTFAINTYDMGCSVSSEHLAGIGFVFLFLEYIKFYKTKELGIGSCILISYTVLLTVGTLFISTFGVFGVALGVGLTEIVWCIKSRERFGPWLWRMVKRYARLVGIVLLPWVLLVVYYYAVGNLDDAIYGAYTFNRTIYTEYNGGYGGSVLKGMLQGFVRIFDLIISSFTLSSFTYTTLIDLLLVGFMFCCLIKMCRDKAYLPALTAFLLVGFASSREIFEFHGTQAVAVICLLSAMFLADVVVVSFQALKKAAFRKQLVVALCTLLIGSSYFANMKVIRLPNYVSIYYGVEWAIEAITEEGEGIWMNELANAILMNADRPSIMNVGTTPWGWEGYGEEVLEKARNGEAPRVAILNKDLTVWGYAISDYAPDLIEYIDENYTQYEDSFMYIRNDYYEEAMDKIAAAAAERQQ